MPKHLPELPPKETFGPAGALFPDYLINRDNHPAAPAASYQDEASKCVERKDVEGNVGACLLAGADVLLSVQDLIERHGGQDFFSLEKSEKFIADFSLTCNCLGPPRKALQAAHNALGKISHYPPEDQEPCRTVLSQFIGGDENVGEIHDRVVLGNGASELIDLIIRNSPNGSFWPGPFETQYKEYERSSKSMGRRVLRNSDIDQPFAVMALVNPCNPTGDFLALPELQELILKRAKSGCTVIVDESMLGWYGPDWRNQSLSGPEGLKWIAEMKIQKNIEVYVMVSWTKLWDCPGLRVGSVVCPTPVERLKVIAHQIPWSMNIAALDFVAEAAQDEEYLYETWDRVKGWRKQFVGSLAEIQPHWAVKGEDWLSWMWIDVGSFAARSEAVDLCKKAGVPVRDGAIGYSMPTHIRICVRGPRDQAIILKELAKVNK